MLALKKLDTHVQVSANREYCAKISGDTGDSTSLFRKKGALVS